MILEKDFICIRNAKREDAACLAKWWNDGRVMAHAGFPNGLGTTAAQVKKEIEACSDDTNRRLVIEFKNKRIGEMAYYNLGNHVAEIGIKICEPQYQGKGLGCVILSMLLDEVFRMGYTKILLDTNLNNTRAQHVYEKIGFVKVRVNIDDYTDQLGEKQSTVVYELTQDTFMNLAKEN